MPDFFSVSSAVDLASRDVLRWNVPASDAASWMILFSSVDMSSQIFFEKSSDWAL
jgi:hypothetical protein